MTPHAPRSSAGRGFSLTEMLVVLGIIVVCVGILLPVIDSARRSARATHCLSNMHQLGIGLHAYLTEQVNFPVGLPQDDGTVPSPQLLLVPYLQSSGVEPDRAEMPVLLCPSEKAPGTQRTSYRGSVGIMFPWAPPRESAAAWKREGVFASVGYGVELEDVSDGAGQTAAFAEHALGDQRDNRVTEQSDYYKVGVSDGETADSLRQKLQRLNPKQAEQRSRGGTPWRQTSHVSTLYTHDALPGERSGWWGDDIEAYVTTASSMHGKGANLLLCDGSSRWVRSDVDPVAWRSLATFQGGERVGSY